VVSHRSVLEKSLGAAREQLGSIAIGNAPPDTTVSFTGRAAMKLPSDGIIFAAPGEVAVRLTAPEHDPDTRTVTVVRGQRVSFEANLPAHPVAAAPVASATTPDNGTALGNVHPAPEPAGESPAAALTSPPPAAAQGETGNGRAGRIVGLALAGVGVALDVGGLLLRSAATTKLDAIETMKVYDESNGNWQTYDHAGVALLVIGSAAIVSGAAVFLVSSLHSDGASPPTESKTSFLVLPRDRGASLALGRRF
jgi:hypothetical protein